MSLHGKDEPVIRSASRQALGLVLAVAVVAVSGACTGDSDPPRSAPSGGSSTASASGSSKPPPSVPFRVRVTRVSGTLAPADRVTVAANVGRVLAAYVDAAFLRGAYPRADFAGSFATFTPGAARTARRDLALLTNSRLGPSTESVRAVRRTAYLSILAPYDVAAGVTARVDLEFLVQRTTAPPARLGLQGRLLLTRDRDGGWRIFGYDVTRSDGAARSGT